MINLRSIGNDLRHIVKTTLEKLKNVCSGYVFCSPTAEAEQRRIAERHSKEWKAFGRVLQIGIILVGQYQRHCSMFEGRE